MTVIVRLGDETRAGRAVDLRDRDLASGTVAAAVRGDPREAIAVECAEPGAVHDRVGVIEPGRGLRVRTALAAAARSRGLSAPQDDDLAAARRARERAEDAVDDAPTEDAAVARRRLAAAEDPVRLRERVATLQGRIRALRERSDDPTAAATALDEAARALSEVETARAAARQALDRSRERARVAWDARERRLRLEDRVANLERAARRSLVAQVREEFAAAVAAVPDADPPSDPFDAPPVVAALAVARVAAVDAPVVLACGRFDTADEAAAWLDAPVIYLRSR